jgi:glycosyltransferase involved in cell wall biosynthesis
VAGEFYEDEKKYLQLISNLGLEKKVILHTRFIPDEEVARYFSVADVVVQPYRSATQSGVTQIAYHFDVPMIVSNVGGLPEIVPHGKVGLVCKPEEDVLAEAIDEILDDKLRGNFSRQIGEEKKRFSWDKMGEAFEKLYLSIKEKR